MARSAKSRKRKQNPGLLATGLSATGRAIAERPVAVGGLTAFAITFAFVAANAIWYQPHPHKSAFFETRHMPPREPAEPIDVTRLEIAPESSAAPKLDLPAEAMMPPTARPQASQSQADPRLVDPAPDARAAVVAEVQRVLAELDLYKGSIDGLTGPQTNAAVATYRQTLGLSEGGGIDSELLRHLGTNGQAEQSNTAVETARGTDQIQTASASASSSGEQRVMRIQAGLRAFGNQSIDLDGQVGSRTEAAILEFQSLFGLPETGMPDEATYEKMREIGLTS